MRNFNPYISKIYLYLCIKYEVQKHRKYIQECIYNDDIQNLQINISIYYSSLLYMFMCNTHLQLML